MKTKNGGPVKYPESSNAVLATVDEAAGMLRVSRWAIFQLLRDDELPRVKVGTRTRIPVASIHQYVERITPATSVSGAVDGQ